MSNCKCTPDETTGWTTVKCCNICGNAVEDFWNVPEKKYEYDGKLALFESILIKMLREEAPIYNMEEVYVIEEIVAKIAKLNCQNEMLKNDVQCGKGQNIA